VTVVATAFYQTSWFEAAVYVVIALVLARVVDYVLARRDAAMERLLGKRPGRADRTRYVMFRRLVVVAILGVGITLALFQFAVFQTLAGAILASTAIVAGVIGIAARAPIANLVSGVMLAFAQPVRLGDYISVNGEFGTVEEITFTFTYIRSADGRHVVIPNEAFASQMVNNYTLGSPHSVVTVDFVVPVDSDLVAVRAAALAVGDELADAPPEGRENLVTVEQVGTDTVSLRLHAWAGEPNVRRMLASELRAGVAARLVADGILGRREANGAG
jgi:small-conductance mechanosensitive channel